MYFFEVDEREAREIAPGVRIRTFWRDQMLISDVLFEPEAVVPNHSHPHEQAGVILSGELSLTIDGETRLLGPGESYLIPGEVEHSAVSAAENTRVWDVFSPVREEYQY